MTLESPTPEPGAAPTRVLSDAELLAGDLTLLGRISDSSNATFLGEVSGHRVIYKPVAGERPLWDFPDGTLAGREYATRLVSDATGWDLVPPTVLRDGPHGTGMVQQWIEAVEADPAPVDLVGPDEVTPDHLVALVGENQEGEPVALVHSDDSQLRRLAILDAVVNNSDRKGGHVLADATGRLWAIDHGLTFHVDPKLRTVLWGWVGTEFSEDEQRVLAHLSDALNGALGETLAGLISEDEVSTTRVRVEALRGAGTFPIPDTRWPAVPWPAF